MSFFLLLLYLVALYVRLDEQFLSLVPYRIMFCLGIAATVASLLDLLAGKRPTFRAPQLYLMVGLTGMVALSVALTGWLGGAVAAFGEFGTTTTVFFLLVLNITSLSRMRIVATLLVVLSLFIAGQGVLAYHRGYQEDKFVLQQRVGLEEMADGNLSGGQRVSADGSEVNLPRIRSLGFLNDPNDLAQALLISLPFLGLAWRRRRWFRNLLLVGVPMAFVLYGVYLTRSRGGILGLLVLALLALRWRVGRTTALVLTAFLAIALVGLNFSGGRSFSDGSSEARMDAWSEGLQMLKANPIWGIGYNGFTDFNRLTAHNSFVLCFAELGLAGYFVWLSLLVITLLQLSSLGKLSGEEPLDRDFNRWARAIFLALCTFLAAAIFLSRTYILTLYMLLALGTALVDIARRAEKPVFELPPIRWATRVAVLELASIIIIYVVVRLNPV